ncbi:hypothetical protein JYT83_00245 [bacterium AH-315-F18]|nr:hypothetical protein [bacterium AH-315-F18]
MTAWIEAASRKRSRHAWLMVTVLGLVVANGALALGFYNKLSTPPPIYYVPGATGEGVALPNRIPDGAIRDFALHYLVSANNFTSETLKRVRKVTAPMLDPRFVVRSRRIFEELEKRSHDLALAAQLVLLDPPDACEVRSLGQGRYEVSSRALYRVFVRSALSKEEPYLYKTYILQAAPSVLNPYGLYVYDLKRIHQKSKDQ